jgi:hypothetical protein
MERIRNGEEAVPLGPSCGEWTLYSTQFLRGHHATYTDLWTERFSKTWCAGTLRLGCPRRIGSSVGAECTLAVPFDGVYLSISFPYKTPYSASSEEQFNRGFRKMGAVEDVGLMPYVAASALPNAKRRYQAPSSSGSTGLRLNPQAQEFIPSG